MWWQDLLWGLWNGLTAWFVLIAHIFNAWEKYPIYDIDRAGNWYDFGFLAGAGSPFFGMFNARHRGGSRRSRTTYSS
ncbi:MAG TPA: hypothetical protein VEQ36_01300 [Thermomicrobiales bacterium]|nr:hypothetical protein [Thermomicrobiales bacterium]